MGREQGRTSDILEAVALLVVDMQETVLNAIAESEPVIHRCAFAIEAARALGIRVIFTEQVSEKLGPTLPALQQLAPDARVFDKSTFSALGAQGLLDHLRKAGVYHLLIAGIETPVCVYQTALHAQDSDLDVTILSDCVGARRPDDARIVLQALAAASCHVLPAETVYYSMLGGSAHRVFSAYTELVKRHGGAQPAAPAKPARPSPKKPRGKAREQPSPPAPPEPAEVLVSSEKPKPRGPRPRDDDRPPDEADAGRPPEDPGEDEPREHSSEPRDADDHEGEAPAAGGEADGADDQDPARKRPRRRRGGARRRKARERAAAGTPPATHDPDAPGEPWTPSAQAEHPAPDASRDEEPASEN